MFPKIMNDENFFKKAAAHGEEPPLTPQNEHQRSGLRFARRVRLPRAVGLAGMFLPIASTLVSHPPPGWWWLVLVGWAFVWPHLAWQIASRAVDPLSREIYNLKTDAVLAGMWVGVMGVNVLPSTAMLMIMCLNLMGAGGPRLFVAGLVLMVVSCLVTLELTGITVSFNSAPLEWWLSLPIIVIYPLLFGWVSYQTATKLAEHKRRLQVMSTRDGMTGVYNRRHWETMLRNEFDNCRRHNRDATLLIIDVIGRFGGDEFAVIMSGTPAESAITAMLRVHEGLNTLRLPNTPQVTLRISVGVAPLNPQMSHYREWLKSADLALYKAKKAGRNRTEVAA